MKTKAGFSSIDVRHTGRLTRDTVTEALVSHEFATAEEARYIVNSVGPHMGHIEDVLRNMAYGHTGTIKSLLSLQLHHHHIIIILILMMISHFIVFKRSKLTNDLNE